MSLADRVAQVEASIPSVRSETALFVRMDGAYAVVTIGPSTLRVANVGWVPPVAGMTVQVEWRNGRPVVNGPAVALSPIGTITGTGTPKATVTVDGVEYVLFIRAGYTPVVGDLVTVNWQTGIIEGAITGQEVPPPEPEPEPVPEGFTDLVIRATASSRYQTSWWGSEPWASNSNRGLWVYGQRLREGLRNAHITGVEVYLPLLQQLGNASIGLAAHTGIPTGAPTITDLVNLPLGGRSGWVRLPDWWGNHFRDNDSGVGVVAPGGGYNRWQSVGLDSLSGALRFAGTR